MMDGKGFLELHWPTELSAVMEKLCVCAAQGSRHQSHIAIKHLKCDLCDWGIDYYMLMNLNLRTMHWQDSSRACTSTLMGNSLQLTLLRGKFEVEWCAQCTHICVKRMPKLVNSMWSQWCFWGGELGDWGERERTFVSFDFCSWYACHLFIKTKNWKFFWKNAREEKYPL